MPLRLYRFPNLKTAGVPFTRKHVTTLEKRGQFPMHIDIGENSVAWIASEVDSWVEEKIRNRRVVPFNAPCDIAATSPLIGHNRPPEDMAMDEPLAPLRQRGRLSKRPPPDRQRLAQVDKPTVPAAKG